MSGPLLEVQDLAVDFLADEGVIQAVRGVSFRVRAGGPGCGRTQSSEASRSARR